MVMTVLSLCATSVALAGCTSDPGTPPPTTPPATSAAPSPSATPTPTPTPDAATPPERPDMSQVDTETAEAVAVYFLQLYPYVYATGDLTEWRTLSHPECIFCASVITNVEEMVAAGEHWEGGHAEFPDVTTTAVTGQLFNVALHVVEAPAQLVTTEGSVSEQSTGGDSLITLVVTAETPETWRVREGEVDEITR
ncbi:hypothetical protein AFE02nite_10550 [Actinotalea fermentans]|uniref:DUF6318 domain-containing protein n=2 Tax=Actinotalea fermentans TaxID=43671 RepID=A0A511YVU2_9CELL|nr:hypothetical protein AFE02nite_10550 [Actinotalea fermentans]